MIGAIDRVNEALLLLLAVVLGALACLAFAQVVARYVLMQPLVWSEELIRYSLIWTVFLGAGLGVRKGLLAAVEIVNQIAPAPVENALRWVCIAISALFWVVLIVYGVRILGFVQGMNSGALEMPMSYVYLAVPVGAAIALVNTLVVAVDPPKPTIEGSIE